MSIDKNDQLSAHPFSYLESKEKVLIYRDGKMIKMLQGNKASALLSKLKGKSELEQQLALAKITGNYKRGNEKMGKS